MRVCVTGGTGFTGTALVRRLLERDHEVIALDKDERWDTPELREAGAEVVLGSVTDEDLVDEVVRGTSAVIHIAAAFREVDKPREHYHRVNVGGTRTVVESARRHGVEKFIYCSTCGVHGTVDDPPADEFAPVEPEDYYQHTKYLGEEVLAELAGEEMRTTILRPAAIYGPGDPGRFYMIFRQVAKGWFPMFGDGNTFYHPLYIDNLIDAFVRCLETDRGAGGTYLVADEDYCTIEELVRKAAEALGREVRIVRLPYRPMWLLSHVVEKICRPLGVAPPLFPRRVAWYRHDRAFDITRAREDLGYDPAVPLDEGLRRTAEWYRETGRL